MSKALVIGGTGPSGRVIVHGLIERGFDVTILHGGQHEVPLPKHVRHIHADPHFRTSFSTATQNLKVDIVIVNYGRLEMIAQELRGKTKRLIAVGTAQGGSLPPHDPAWGPLGLPLNVDETSERLAHTNVDEEATALDRFASKVARAEHAVFQAHMDGAYRATYVGYPSLYGPRATAPRDWCIVRRILDGRHRMVIADGGNKVELRGYIDNMAHAILLVVDSATAADGKKFYAADQFQYTLRQRIDFICDYLDHEMELMDMPYDLARPCHPLWMHHRNHRFRTTTRIVNELGYSDAVPPADALRRTVDWLVQNPIVPGCEEEKKIADPFNYRLEDQLIDKWNSHRENLSVLEYDLPVLSHPYRHPKDIGESWSQVEYDWRK